MLLDWLDLIYYVRELNNDFIQHAEIQKKHSDLGISPLSTNKINGYSLKQF